MSCKRERELEQAQGQEQEPNVAACKKARLPTLDELKEVVLADLKRAANDEALVLPPLQAPRFPVFPLRYTAVTAPRATVGDTLVPTIRPLSQLVAMRTQHALPARRFDTEYVDAVDADGSLVPAPPAVVQTMPYFGFVDATCLQNGTDAENNFRAAAEASGWRTRNIQYANGKSFYETLNVERHVDLILRNGEDELWVDVKALRSLIRHRLRSNATLVLEVHLAGCIQKGHADVFAYEVFNPFVPECAKPELLADAAAALASHGLARRDADGNVQLGSVFVLIDRVKLRDWASAVLDWSAPPVAFPEQSLWRLYCRNDQTCSMIVNVPLEQAYAAAGCGIMCV